MSLRPPDDDDADRSFTVFFSRLGSPLRYSSETLFTLYPNMTAPRWQFGFYFGNQLASAVLSLILLATLTLSSRIHRHVSVVNFLATFLVTSLIYCLLLFAGSIGNNASKPPETLCLLQGSLVLVCPVAQSFASMDLVLHIFFKVLALVRSRQLAGPRLSTWIGRSSLLMTWAVPAALFGLNLARGLAQPDKVHPATFYCLVYDKELSTVNMAFTAMPAILAILAAIGLSYLLVLIRKRTRSLGSASKVDIAFAIRSLFFSAYLLAGACLAIAFSSDFAAVGPDLFISTAGVVAGCLFGTQKDILRLYAAKLGYSIFSSAATTAPLSYAVTSMNIPQHQRIRSMEKTKEESSTSDFDQPAFAISYALDDLESSYTKPSNDHPYGQELPPFSNLDDSDHLRAESTNSLYVHKRTMTDHDVANSDASQPQNLITPPPARLPRSKSTSFFEF